MRRGFTLLELLVVVGIVSILVALLTVSFTAIQMRSRDTRRREDLKVIQDSLEQYYANNSFDYPADSGSCKTAVTTYIKQGLPKDPKSGADYSFVCALDSFCVCADLEVTGIGAGNSTLSNCSSWGDGDYYCVGSLQ